MADLFGDDSLFAEFEKDREAEGSFIHYDENSAVKNSRIIFEDYESDTEEEESDSEWIRENAELLNPPKPKPKPQPAVTPDAGTDANADGDSNKTVTDSSDATANGDDKTESAEGNEKDENGSSDKVMEVEASNGEAADPQTATDNETAKGPDNEGSAEVQKDGEDAQKADADKPDSSAPVQIKTEIPEPSSVQQSATTTNAKVTNEKPAEKVKVKEEVKMLDQEDTAWLYEHLYTSSKDTKTKPNIQQLKYERNKFNRYCKILDSTRYVPDDESPAVQLLFNNNTFARKYRQQIEQFIKGLLWQEFNSNNPDNVGEITSVAGAPSCVDINDSLTAEQRTEKMRQRHTILGNSQFHKQFLIDFLGWPFTSNEPARCNINWEIPLYGQVFDEVYADPTQKAKKAVKKENKKPVCWNCSQENCRLSDCRLPRNPARIAANRKEFMEQQAQNQQSRTPKFTGAARYHLDPELASKFVKFRPGTVSDSLREAMGLNEEQIPQFIYKMRLFGYPPGWLAEAKQVQSGVTVFDKEGKAIGKSDNMEDGELNDGASSGLDMEYDVNKIIEYPGFTVPLPDGFVDEHSSFSMPPIQQHQLKKTLITQSEEKAAAAEEKKKERKRKRQSQSEAEGGETEEDGAGGKKAKTEGEEDGEVTEAGENGEEKMEGTSEKTGDNTEDKGADSDATEEGDNEANKTAENIEEDKEDAPSNESPVKNVLNSSTISLSLDYGTPILERQKGGLPDASKFGVGVEEHIPFENLPDSVGTFEKMRNIFDIIRQKVKK